MVGYLDGVGECGERDRKISMQQSPAVLCIFNMEKAAGVAVATNPKSAQSAHPSVPHPPTTLAAASPPPVPLLLPGHLSADRELRTQTGLLRGAGSRDQAQTRDHVQSSTLDPRAGACASGYWCAADSLPSSPPSSSLFYCCHLLCTQTPQKVICIHSLLSSRFCRLRDVLLPIPLIFSTFIN